MIIKEKLPEFRDKVKHKTSDTTGIVIARYDKFKDGNALVYLDVRSDEDKIYYQTPAENWVTTEAYIP